MKLLGCVCVCEGPPEGWNDLKFKYPLAGTRPASDPGTSKLRKVAGNWSGDEDMRNLGPSSTEIKSNKRKRNTVAERSVIPK
jgi:hypothetical protein